jgi:uncharacterized membrane protein
MEDLAQITIDVLAWFIQPFAFVLIVFWVTGLFRRD